MTRRQSLGPLDPIYRVKTQYGSVAAGNTPPSVTSPSVTIDQAAGQSDPTAVSPILFTAVFSRAVTGFATGDVTLTGTAGATVGAVTDSGDHITYTVSVSGMTASGTVIATIAAGVCTAISDGQPNLASTSTDNTVTYGSPLGLLYAAIEYFSPLSHWPLRDASGQTTLVDVGSLANNATAGVGTLLSQATAPDAYPCPVWTTISTSGGSAPDQNGYTPSNASGITVVFCARPTLVTNSGVFVSKRADGGGNGEWEIATSASGKVSAITFVSGTTAARVIQTNSVVLATATWALIIARFSGSTTGYPDLRINGVAVAQTQSSSGTANGNDTGKLQIGRRNSNSTQFPGAQAHVAIYAGQLTDPQCAVIEAAADAEGWY